MLLRKFMIFAITVIGITFALCTMFASVALAADAAVAQDPWWHLALVDVFIGIGGIVLAFIGKNMGKLFDYLAEKSKLSFIARVDNLIMEVVMGIYADERAAMIAARSDGKITKEEKNKLKLIAIDRIKGLIGLDGLAKLTGLFTAEPVQLSLALSQKVESAITMWKNAGAVRKPDPTR